MNLLKIYSGVGIEAFNTQYEETYYQMNNSEYEEWNGDLLMMKGDV